MSGTWSSVSPRMEKEEEKDEEKDVCFKEIGSHALNMITIIGSIVDITWGGGRGEGFLYDHLRSTIIFPIIMN